MPYVREDLAHFKPYKVEHIATHNLGDNENRLIDWSFLHQKLGAKLTVSDLSYYGDNQYAGVRQAFADTMQVETNQVVQGVGSEQLLQMIVTAFLGNEDTLLSVSPDFFMYQVFSEMNANQYKEYPLDWTKGYPDLIADDFLSYAEKVHAKVILLSNPNNPTSVAFARGELEKIVAGFDGIVVLDEAYIDYADSPSFIDRVNEYPNLIVLRTLSKAYGLAGLRLGFAISCPSLATELDSIVPPYSMPNIVARVGELALQEKELVADSVSETKRIRQDFSDFLKEQPATTVLPSQANFVTFKAPYGKALFELAQRKDFAFKYYEAGPLTGFIRLTIGRADEMEELKGLVEQVVTEE